MKAGKPLAIRTAPRAGAVGAQGFIRTKRQATSLKREVRFINPLNLKYGVDLSYEAVDLTYGCNYPGVLG
jgi:hypothetical protein